jgi:hypothetical protein
MRWAEHVKCMTEMRYTFKMLNGKRREKKHLGNPD